MLVYHFVTLVIAASIPCLTSAFSTHFVMEGVNEVKKMAEVEETRNLKMEENNSEKKLIPDAIEVKVVPIMTNVFTQTEDLLNMTPLKLVTAIAAQHLLTAVQSIPVAGNSAQDTFNMFEGIVKELNKTVQIIKLTAEYVNISGHYILSTMDRFIKNSCDQDTAEEIMTLLKKKFLNSIDDHILSAVKELNQKTQEREITGSDILVSSAYHMVTAFQEMTNYAVTLTSESNKKCSSNLSPNIEITHPSDEVKNGTETKNPYDVLTFQPIPEQVKIHKSIKKDQATPKSTDERKFNFENFQDQMTIENLNGNQDLTVEVFSPEALIHDRKQEFVMKPVQNVNKPENFKLEYLPLKTITLFENPKKEEINEVPTKKQSNDREFKQNNLHIEKLDKELASSAVDSLSNIPWASSEARKLENTAAVTDSKKSSQQLMSIFELLSSGYNKPLLNQPKEQDNELVEPVCGVDRKSKKIIIFLNDNKRVTHNKLHGTDYENTNMETCVGFFLRNPALLAPTNQVNNVDLRPR